MPDTMLPMPIGELFEPEPVPFVNGPRKTRARQGPLGDELWQSRVAQDLDEVRCLAQCESTMFVTFDAEGYNGCQDSVTSLGFAVLPSSQPISCLPPISTEWPWPAIDLDHVVAHYGVQSYSIRLVERPSGRRERFLYGDVDEVSVTNVEEHVNTLLKATAQPSPQLVLVGWDIQSDLAAMRACCPALFQRLNRWVDLSRVAARLSAGARMTQTLSLRDFLLTAGLAKNNHSVQGQHGAHDPGMDAARTAAALMALLAVPPMATVEYCRWTRLERETRSRETLRPPHHRHHYLVRIQPHRAEQSLPQAINRAFTMSAFIAAQFGQFPTDVCLYPRKRARRTRRTHGWIYFDNHAAMEQLVAQLDGIVKDNTRLQLSMEDPVDQVGPEGEEAEEEEEEEEEENSLS